MSSCSRGAESPAKAWLEEGPARERCFEVLGVGIWRARTSVLEHPLLGGAHQQEVALLPADRHGRRGLHLRLGAAGYEEVRTSLQANTRVALQTLERALLTMCSVTRWYSLSRQGKGLPADPDDAKGCRRPRPARRRRAAVGAKAGGALWRGSGALRPLTCALCALGCT